MHKPLALAFAICAATLTMPAFAQDFDPMQMADTNTDGKVSLEEYTSFQNGGFQYAAQGADKVKVATVDPMMKALFDGVAVDADGNATAAAFAAVIPARFKAADKDGDGALNQAELLASFGPPPAQ